MIEFTGATLPNYMIYQVPLVCTKLRLLHLLAFIFHSSLSLAPAWLDTLLDKLELESGLKIVSLSIKSEIGTILHHLKHFFNKISELHCCNVIKNIQHI